jgi:cytochrome c oxidase subunit 2
VRLACYGLLLVAACGGDGNAVSQASTRADAASADGNVIRIVASRWSYDPDTIELQKDVPVTLEITSSDVHHGFNVPGLKLRADVLPNQAGSFPLHCDYYCGSGHEGMEGQIIVK